MHYVCSMKVFHVTVVDPSHKLVQPPLMDGDTVLLQSSGKVLHPLQSPKHPPPRQTASINWDGAKLELR